MNWMDKLSRTNECVTIGRCKISQLFFANNLWFSWLPTCIKWLAAACGIAGMKISTPKTEELHLSSKPVQCPLQTGRVSLKHKEKFKYLGVTLMSV